MQKDPFRDLSLRDRRTKLLGMAALVGSIALIVAGYQHLMSGPQEVLVGQVLRFGRYAHEGGDWPLLLVRLPDGSEREIYVRRDVVLDCRVGDKVSLIRINNYLRVTPDGCAKALPANP
jgi:hypothetical protein